MGLFLNLPPECCKEPVFYRPGGLYEIIYKLTKSTLLCLVQNVKYGFYNAKVMDMFEDPQNADEWLQVLGNRSERAPYQMMFPDKAPDGISPLNTDIPGCASPGFECSCTDCGNCQVL